MADYGFLTVTVETPEGTTLRRVELPNIDNRRFVAVEVARKQQELMAEVIDALEAQYGLRPGWAVSDGC